MHIEAAYPLVILMLPPFLILGLGGIALATVRAKTALTKALSGMPLRGARAV